MTYSKSLMVLTAVLMAGVAHAGEMLRVTVDKAELITLSAQPSVVVVADPAIADVIVEQNRLLFVVGKRAGETRLFVYGGNGKAILTRDIVVTPQDERAVTVIRDTTPTTYSCAPRCAALGGGAPATALKKE